MSPAEAGPPAHYELRQYQTTLAGAAQFQANFQADLLPVLEDCGFDLVGAWTTDVGDGSAASFHWMLRWTSLDQRARAYETVHADPRHAAFNRANLPLLTHAASTLLKPTAFSPLA